MKKMYLISLSALILCMSASLGAQAFGSIISKGEEAVITPMPQDDAWLRAELAKVRGAKNSADIDEMEEIIDRLTEGETVDGGAGDPRLAMAEARLRTELEAEAARLQPEREIALLAERRAATERSDRREMLVRR